MSARKLELEYVRSHPRARSGRAILFIAALFFALDSAWYYHQNREQLLASETLLARAKLRPSVKAQPLRKVTDEEYASARKTVARLSTPWNRLFGALEAAQTERIALLSVEPDAEKRTVTITGEAKDYLAALSYVASLSAQEDLHRVYLMRHEQRGSAQRPLGFTISATWSENR
jgi:hypothetical protein